MSPAPLPLHGLTFLNLRAAEDASDLTALLAVLGARVVESPAIAFAAPSDCWASFDARLAKLSAGDWIAFTSATALRWTLRRMGDLGRAPASLSAARIAAVGRGTARALAEAGLPAHVVPPERFQAEGLLEALLPHLGAGETVWLPRAEQGREALVEGLRRAGHPVCVTAAYRTVAAPEGLAGAAQAIEQGGVDWVVFTSSSMVTHLMTQLSPAGRAGLGRARIACLGRVTARTAEGHGLAVAVVPERQDLAGLVDSIAAAAPHVRARDRKADPR